jgi:hypothetical protein
VPLREPVVTLTTGAPKQSLSKLSYLEQGYTQPASSAPSTPANPPPPSTEDEKVNAVLKTLNEEYESKFGFKFVVFVAGRPRHMIPDIIRQRIQNTREEELQTGLKAMIDIARDRLKKFETGAVRL